MSVMKEMRAALQPKRKKKMPGAQSDMLDRVTARTGKPRETASYGKDRQADLVGESFQTGQKQDGRGGTPPRTAGFKGSGNVSSSVVKAFNPAQPATKKAYLPPGGRKSTQD